MGQTESKGLNSTSNNSTSQPKESKCEGGKCKFVKKDKFDSAQFVGSWYTISHDRRIGELYFNEFTLIEDHVLKWQTTTTANVKFDMKMMIDSRDRKSYKKIVNYVSIEDKFYIEMFNYCKIVYTDYENFAIILMMNKHNKIERWVGIDDGTENALEKKVSKEVSKINNSNLKIP